MHFKVLVFPQPLGNFFVQSPHLFGKAKHPTGFRTLFWVFEQLANTRTLHSNENSTLINFFLNTTIAARSLVKISNFLPVLNYPDSVFNLSGPMKNKAKHNIMLVHCLF